MFVKNLFEYNGQRYQFKIEHANTEPFLNLNFEFFKERLLSFNFCERSPNSAILPGISGCLFNSTIQSWSIEARVSDQKFDSMFLEAPKNRQLLI